MSKKLSIELPDIQKIIFLVTLLLVSCASLQQRMTGAALEGDDAALDRFLRPGAADINASAAVKNAQTLCPGQNILTPLQAASCAGHAATVRKLIENKADLNLATSTGQTPLFLALNNGKDDVVRLLVKSGAKPDTVDAGGNTVLMLFAKRGNKSLAEFMLKNGASVQIKNQAGETALMLASDAKTAKMLIDLGSDPLLKNNNGDSALHIAARNGNADVAKLFLEHGVDIVLRNKNGDTALSLARAGSRGSVTAVLEEKFRQLLDKEMAEGDQAAKKGKFDEALSLYTAAFSMAGELGGTIEQDVRVKFIKFVNGQASPPVLSEKSREHLIRSAYLLKHGHDNNAVEKEMAEILRIDPWWLEGYYNLGLLQADQNKFEKATQNLKLFIAAAPAGPKSQAAQNKIYEIQIAKEEADKVNGLQGQWTDSRGKGYTVTVNGNKLQIVSYNGLVLDLTLTNNIIEGSVEGKAYRGPHGCTMPGQIHPVNGKLDSDAKGLSLEFLWSSYDTRYHCVNMMGVTSNCCLLCDEVCDAVTIIATSNTRLRLAPSK